MYDVRLIYNEERDTWNVYDDNNWMYESKNYEDAERVFDSFFWQDDDDYEEEVF